MSLKSRAGQWIKKHNRLDMEQILVKVPGLAPEFESFKLIQVSDTHLPRNASTIKQIAEKVRQERPDIILLTGDLTDRPTDISQSSLFKLCRKLVRIAPCYGISGNHEKSSGQLDVWKKILQRSSVKLVDDDFFIIRRQEASLAVIGLAENRPYVTDFLDHPHIKESCCRVLLVHRPQVWVRDYPSAKSLQPHLVFSGHAHGGQVRLPFLGGLFAPDQGFLPRYTSGLYQLRNGVNAIVSRGLVSTVKPLRINNLPHIPVVTLTGRD